MVVHFMLEHNNFCADLYFIYFMLKSSFRKCVEKKTEKNLKKKKGKKPQPCAQPNSPSAHSLSPSPAQDDLRPAKLAQPGRGAPLLFLWLTGGPHLAVPVFLLPP
jgi:hypothetical protein